MTARIQSEHGQWREVDIPIPPMPYLTLSTFQFKGNKKELLKSGRPVWRLDGYWHHDIYQLDCMNPLMYVWIGFEENELTPYEEDRKRGQHRRERA